MVTEEKKVKLNKGAEKKMEHIFGYIINPQLWSPDSPQLYKVEATLLDPKGNILDKRTVNTGLRDFYFDSQGRFIFCGNKSPGNDNPTPQSSLCNYVGIYERDIA